MEEKKDTIFRKIGRIFRKIERSPKYQWIVFSVLMSVILIGYCLAKIRLDKQFQIVEDDFSWVCQVDKIEEQNGKVVLSGFAFQLEKDADEKMFDILLYDIKTGKGYYPNMKYSDRKDVNDYFLCEYDYTKSGFTATISSKKLDLEHGVYEVLLRPEGRQESYSLGIYYVNGEMYFTNPNKFVPLDVAGTDLEKIVENGVLRVYRPDYGMYVYQYEEELYWIAEEWYGFVDNDTYVQFQMNTTQINNLPEDRLANNHFWSNIGFLFQSKELTDWNTGKYRVTKCSLPKEYSITHIWTGNYINEWIWQSDFRPWYIFNKE